MQRITLWFESCVGSCENFLSALHSYTVISETLKSIDNLEDLRVVGKMILKMVFKNFLSALHSYTIISEKLKPTHHLEDLRVVGKMILKRVFKNRLVR